MPSKQWVAPRRIQRLLMPQMGFSASNGFVRASLSKNQEAALAQVCRLDYMGNNEFEGTEIAQIISYMTTKRRQFVTKTHRVMICETHKTPDITEQLYIDVHFLAPRHIMPQLVNWVASVDAKGDRELTIEPTRFLESVMATIQGIKEATLENAKIEGRTLKMFSRCTSREWNPTHPLGWLNLDVGAAYFLDETMRNAFGELIGVKR